jgi:hypothetical protein
MDLVARGSQLRLCGRWAATDGSPQLVHRWLAEVAPLLEASQPTERRRKHDESCSVMTADLDGLVQELRREFDTRAKG